MQEKVKDMQEKVKELEGLLVKYEGQQNDEKKSLVKTALPFLFGAALFSVGFNIVESVSFGNSEAVFAWVTTLALLVAYLFEVSKGYGSKLNEYRGVVCEALRNSIELGNTVAQMLKIVHAMEEERQAMMASYEKVFKKPKPKATTKPKRRKYIRRLSHAQKVTLKNAFADGMSKASACRLAGLTEAQLYYRLSKTPALYKELGIKKYKK